MTGTSLAGTVAAARCVLDRDKDRVVLVADSIYTATDWCLVVVDRSDDAMNDVDDSAVVADRRDTWTGSKRHPSFRQPNTPLSKSARLIWHGGDAVG